MTTTMTNPAPADVQRWSEELARNPASLAFLPLARAYRRQGRLDLAMSLCHRGLEQNPAHVEGHALLALLYLESGDRARAADEWSTVLRLKPGNFEALRGMGFRYLEQGEIDKAKQHLERAALIRPTDTAVQEALRLLSARLREVEAVPVLELEDEAIPVDAGSGASADAQAQAERIGDDDSEAGPGSGAIAGASEDPAALFDAMLGGPVLGVLLLDGQGRVLAGRLVGAAAARGEEVGALIGGTSIEAGRVVEHLGLYKWTAMMLECGSALLQLSPAADGTMLVVVARRDTPRGWIARAASRAISLTEPLLGSQV